MTTKAEIGDLLTIITAYDRRTVGDADIRAWHLILADYPLDDCAQAVIDHYTESTEWLMPKHIVDRARSIAWRREGQRRRAELDAQLEAEGITAIDAAPPAEPNTDWAALEHQLRRRGAPTLPAPPKVDRRHDPTRLDEARRELDAARPVDPPNLSNSAPGERQVAGSLRVKETETR